VLSRVHELYGPGFLKLTAQRPGLDRSHCQQRHGLLQNRDTMESFPLHPDQVEEAHRLLEANQSHVAGCQFYHLIRLSIFKVEGQAGGKGEGRQVMP
jgi:hypothetical protein